LEICIKSFSNQNIALKIKFINIKKRNLNNILNLEIKEIEDRLITDLNSLNQKKLRASYIHSDLSEVNLLIKNNKLNAIIDFDDFNQDFITYDTAIFIAHSYACRKRIQRKRMKIFLKNYQKHISLNAEEKKALYYYIKYRLLGILWWYASHLKSHSEHKENVKKGIARNTKAVLNFEKLTFDEFLTFF